MAIARDDERALLAAARDGDRAAVTVLFERYETALYRFALRMCGGRVEEARDVLQETLLAAWRGLPAFRGEARVSTWLFQIARSFCSKARRLHVGEPRVLAPLDAPDAVRLPGPDTDAPDARAHARELGEVLEAALASLPEHHREVLVLKDVEGLSAEEISAVVGDGVPAVKSRLHRARLELRQRLEGVLGEALPVEAPCPELAEVLSGYAAGEIDRVSCEAMEAHMEGCARCAQACESLKASVALCSHAPGDEVPAPIRAAVRRALAAAPAT